jgi:hypothetical protein
VVFSTGGIKRRTSFNATGYLQGREKETGTINTSFIRTKHARKVGHVEAVNFEVGDGLLKGDYHPVSITWGLITLLDLMTLSGSYYVGHAGTV